LSGTTSALRLRVSFHAHQMLRIIFVRRSSFMIFTQDFSAVSFFMRDPADPVQMAKIGIRNASVFKGYCATHDTLLFSRAESSPFHKRNGMMISLHLRALSVEYCRKRQVADMLKRMSELTTNANQKAALLPEADKFALRAKYFRELYLGNLFALMGGSDKGSVEYVCLPFSRNLRVSCCGCLNCRPGVFDSVLGFNLVSYADMSLLVLTTFGAQKRYLDEFLSAYFPNDLEQMINDIEFLHCEEPLIAPRFWQFLCEEEKLQVRLSLRHPGSRTELHAPRAIRIAPKDLIIRITPETLNRLSPKMFRAANSYGDPK
jgi:hypothetical protein